MKPYKKGDSVKGSALANHVVRLSCNNFSFCLHNNTKLQPRLKDSGMISQ